MSDLTITASSELRKSLRLLRCDICGRGGPRIRLGVRTWNSRKRVVCWDCRQERARRKAKQHEKLDRRRRSGMTYLGPKVRQERGNVCEICGEKHWLVLHHVKPVSEGGANTRDNLQLLCRPCHKKAHGLGETS